MMATTLLILLYSPPAQDPEAVVEEATAVAAVAVEVELQ